MNIFDVVLFTMMSLFNGQSPCVSNFSQRFFILSRVFHDVSKLQEMLVATYTLVMNTSVSVPPGGPLTVELFQFYFSRADANWCHTTMVKLGVVPDLQLTQIRYLVFQSRACIHFTKMDVTSTFLY